MKKIFLLILPFLVCSGQPESKKPVLQDSTRYKSYHYSNDSSVVSDSSHGNKNVSSLKNELSDTTEQPDKGRLKSGYTELISLKGKRSIGDGVKNFLHFIPVARYSSSSFKVRELEGKTTFRLLILETGQVHSCAVLSTTIKDQAAVKFLQSKVLRWDFGGIDAPEDKTELIFSLFLRKTGK